MIISLNWLKDYIDLSGISNEELIEKLTTSGSEVEEVLDKSKELENIVVGKVESVSKHPNADKLSVCKVNDGEKIYDIVCGAPNVAEGQTIALAKVGSIIPNGKFEIKKAKIRGEKSEGMICAEDELNLGDDHSGIMVLDDKLKLGTPIAEALDLSDIIIDIAITPNRADSLSHIGIARDVAALFNRKINFPDVNQQKYNIVDKNEFAKVVVENNEDCPRYSAIVVKNVTVKESPEWLKQKLTSIGLRPINNIVDITNFVLHEIGQPLHAFDLDTLTDATIVVKNMKEEFKFTTLDSKERSMLPTDLMICDAAKPVAIAGVMGGENSEVSENTKNILIESAYFNPSSVRKTAKNLLLSTDASFRFERGTDPNITMIAAIRAAELISEIAGGEIVNDLIDVYADTIKPKHVSVRFERISKILGFEIKSDQVKQIFKNLEFKIIDENNEKLVVQIPTFRHDIVREIDLIEEIVRIYGLDLIPNISHIKVKLDDKVDNLDFDNLVKNIFTSINFNETISNSLLSKEKTIRYDNAIKVLNPQSAEMSVLRTSLIPGMLLNISRNLKVKENKIRFFEIGQIFESKNNSISSFDDFNENRSLVVTLCDNNPIQTWQGKSKKIDYYDLSGIFDYFVNSLKISGSLSKEYRLEPDETFEFSFLAKHNKNIFALGGKVNTELLKKFEIDEDVFLFEANLDYLKNIDKNENNFTPLLKYPKVYRDVSFVLDKNVSYNAVEKIIRNSSTKLLKNVNLFDIFESETLGANKKSLAFELEYYDERKTLTDEDIDKEFWRTIDVVKQKLNAELRGK